MNTTPEPLETEPVEEQPKPRAVSVSPPVLEFVMAFTAAAEALGTQNGFAGMSRAATAQSILALARELRGSIQRKSEAEVIRGTVAIGALSLLLFLSVTPHYQEVEGGEGSGEEDARPEAQGAEATEAQAVLTQETEQHGQEPEAVEVQGRRTAQEHGSQAGNENDGKGTRRRKVRQGRPAR